MAVFDAAQREVLAWLQQNAYPQWVDAVQRRVHGGPITPRTTTHVTSTSNASAGLSAFTFAASAASTSNLAVAATPHAH